MTVSHPPNALWHSKQNIQQINCIANKSLQVLGWKLVDCFFQLSNLPGDIMLAKINYACNGNEVSPPTC